MSTPQKITLQPLYVSGAHLCMTAQMGSHRLVIHRSTSGTHIIELYTPCCGAPFGEAQGQEEVFICTQCLKTQSNYYQIRVMQNTLEECMALTLSPRLGNMYGVLEGALIREQITEQISSLFDHPDCAFWSEPNVRMRRKMRVEL